MCLLSEKERHRTKVAIAVARQRSTNEFIMNNEGHYCQ
ncbi:hypothetical protein SA22_2288 [Salmonella enterica subsp. enterica serovar Agona str. 22.H.04]|uniref:Cytoplasmic protein n=1 Tax=Salmonella agona (strain SL483) TaxID=454166 RepID=B5F1K2_SALA4|nr:hypothetical protein SeAg_B4440 [Salmonella enterica subsp. enterica serovar Agona str. SL483]CCR01860.1 hypothetical protein SA73_3091 [Salmonella enterica subsp. enterica serovar Agona str. 73.H.09]CCR04182.1 hypothetical protein SA72_0731 [Salmonella enterica subsp. enterica serovar Agona str. 72.A.52]CCR10388.1 hypothetical protein SA71_2368 [Salmonella enterica subsp. enterica serovar Agona str. 71.E.05]CCR15304.1 hypothetical protein SA70_2685 [Salmonella enterica subsp. enterica serov